MEVDTVLPISALMGARFTLVEILAKSSTQQLVSLRANAGEPSWLIYTLKLAQVTGVAALVNIVAGVAISVQLEALVTPANESAICVVATLLARGTHVTFVHIDTGSVVTRQLEARLTLAGEGARRIDATVLAVTVTTLINVHTFSSYLAVSFRTFAVEAPVGIDTLLTWLAVVDLVQALIHIHTGIWFQGIRLVARWTGVFEVLPDHRWLWWKWAWCNWWWALRVGVIDD